MKSHPDMNAKNFLDYVPIGIDTSVYRPLSSEEHAEFKKEFHNFTNNRFKDVKFIVGYIGRFAERKQLLSVLDSFYKWSKDKDDVMLFVHSPGADQGNALSYVVNMRYRDEKIVYSNATPQQQTDELINKFYNMFDILVNRSSAEGFGLPIAEAMSVGVPCISINNAGPQHLIRPDNGWLLEADCLPLFGNHVTPYIQTRYVTDSKFIAALDDAYNNIEGRKEKAANCRSFIEKHYSVQQMVKGIEKSLQLAITSWKPYPEYTLTAWPVNAGRPETMKDILEAADNE